MSSFTRNCLNGWWDFQPVFNDSADGRIDLAAGVPQQGWTAGAMLVPSVWNKPLDAVRAPGEAVWRSAGDTHSPTGAMGDKVPAGTEYLLDAYGYPEAWNGTRAGWLRRSLDTGPAQPGRRRWLRFEGVMPRSWVFIGGQPVASHIHPTLPFAVDIEDRLGQGPVELAVRIADYEREPGRPNRCLAPTGNWIPGGNSGIWQNVWLEERGEIRVAAVDIRTSTRTRTLDVRWTIANDSPAARAVTLKPSVVPWARNGDPLATPPVLALPERVVQVPAGATVEVRITQPWAEAVWWEPGRPQLYQLVSRLDGEGGEIQIERFGFREVWIEGPDLMLNDHPIHLFSDWGHKLTPFYQTEPWIRQWFGMMRDAHLNHTRLHTHPHPPLVLDLADEEGILVTDEAGLHGSGGSQAGDDPRYWQAAEDHVRRFVARDRNRPCVVLWSVENEMRWNGDRTDLAKRELPRLRHLFNELDPTRPAYHDGDSSLWNENEQAIVSRHYGKESSGLGWWNRKQPLHSGETGVYHYSGPNNTCHLAGDRVWADFDEVDKAASLDTALIVESGRTLGVSCFGPWNLSALQNLRPHPAVRLTYADWTVPGVKPLRVEAGASEFCFWEGGSGYTPGPGFDLQARAFRPLALIDRSRRTGYRAGSRFRRELFLVNDTPAVVAGRIDVIIARDGEVLARASLPVEAGRGRVGSVKFDLPIPVAVTPGRWSYQAGFVGADGAVDTWERGLFIDTIPAVRLRGAVAVIGNGSSARLLRLFGVKAKRLKRLDGTALRGISTLLIERHWVKPGSDQHRAVRDFVAAGGRVVLLEQEASLFPGLLIEANPVSTAFIRAPGHPAFTGLVEDDLRDWGDDSYAQVVADTLVADRLYRKDNGAAMLPLCETGEGGFGNGGLEHTPLFATPVGRGLVIACQFLLTDKAVEQPAALRLFANLLAHADGWKPASPAPVMEAGDADPRQLVRQARAGATVLAGPLDVAGLKAWSAATGITLAPVPVEDCYQAVRVGNSPLTAGLSNEDACGIESWTYSGNQENLKVCRLAIRPVAGLDPLWELPQRALLAEMFVHGGRSEVMRAHTRTAMHHPAPPVGVVAGLLRLGKGRVFFDQFDPPRGEDGAPKRLRLGRPALRLRANLGMPPPADLLTGERTAGSLAASKGLPIWLRVRHGAVNRTEREEFLADCVFSPERMLSMPLIRRGAWETLESADGCFTIAAGREHWLYFVIMCPVARQNLATNLGVPNPEALTFCDLTGSGKVELWVNGKPAGTAKIPGTLSDIALEQGNNHLLLHWTGGAGRIGLGFRNIMRRMETEFAFA
jgi:hypothetical protein